MTIAFNSLRQGVDPTSPGFRDVGLQGSRAVWTYGYRSVKVLGLKKCKDVGMWGAREYHGGARECGRGVPGWVPGWVPR